MYNCGICMSEYNSEEEAHECYNYCKFVLMKRTYLRYKKRIKYIEYQRMRNWVKQIEARKKINTRTTFWRLADDIMFEFNRFCSFCYMKDCGGNVCKKNEIFKKGS